MTLGGGFGHLMRRHGLTADNLRAVDLVTADAHQLRVDADSEPELLWGLRGGGGNFGIATALEYDLHPVGPLVLGGPVYWPLEQAPEVLRVLRDLAPNAPDELGIMIVGHRAPPIPPLPPERYGSPVLGLLLTWCGDIAQGTRAMDPLRTVGTPLGDLVRPVPYRAVQTLLDGGAPRGTHAYWRSHRLPDLSDAVIDRIVSLVESVTSPLSLLAGWAIGGAVSRVAPDATAVGKRDVGFELRVIAQWPRRWGWRPPQGLGARGLGGTAAPQRRAPVPGRALRRRPHRSASRLRRWLRPPPRPQEPLRPHQRLRPQRQHPTQRPS